ncbi:uncharacterized protein LOC111701443 [Eurytemora carolleeae]|uniref:uncharacterized protein LOC111701443 n=1 Tax=Eurytemora carolleeae TaxID=1294199 RepID=UPI000C789321|nr:uncharacterized protein LOC111701443 [Eurytemora carolleeae]|eukprot:XP_023328497.1 uncharacterized protein LOC111701443 [Eurytemora affinis]
MLKLILFILCFLSANCREFKVKVDLSTPYITNLPVKQTLNSGVLLRTSIVGTSSLSTNSSLLERAQETGNLHLTAIYQGYHNHWSLDLEVGESAGDKFLCTNHLVEKQSDHNVTVGVFSTRQKPVYVQIQVVHEDINIELDSEREFKMNQHSSRVFSFFPNLGNIISIIIIIITSISLVSLKK